MQSPMMLLTLCAAASVAHALVIKGPLDSCGKVASYEHAKPADYVDAMTTKFSAATEKREDVTFKTGDKVTYKCEAGFTVDGAKDGLTTFSAECSDMGYFKPDGVCVQASKCGAVPAIPHASATAENLKGAVQFACNPGHSLDGETVVAGGSGKNQLFSLKCIEFSSEYEAFDGECKPYAFVASAESTRIYGDVFEALFVVTCKGKLTKAFSKGEEPPVAATCASLEAGKTKCGELVADIKREFETKKAAVITHKEDKEWYDTKGKPSVGDESQTFCEELYTLVELPKGL